MGTRDNWVGMQVIIPNFPLKFIGSIRSSWGVLIPTLRCSVPPPYIFLSVLAKRPKFKQVLLNIKY